jgi:hypothetical protein
MPTLVPVAGFSGIYAETGPVKAKPVLRIADLRINSLRSKLFFMYFRRCI